MLNSILLGIFFLFYFSSTIFSQEKLEKENSMLLWDPIPNAIKYQLEVRNENKEIILKEEVNQTSYNLNLEPGNYSHRIGGYNKFNKLATQSEWINFTVAKSFAPEITSEKTIVCTKKILEKTIHIKGNHFSKYTKLTLTNKTGKVKITSIKLNDGIFELVLDNKETIAGNYNLTLENPRNKTLTIKDFYILEEDNAFALHSSYPYWKAAGMSMVLPGWGQVKKDQIASAAILDLALIASIGYYKASLNNFHSEKKSYDESLLMAVLFQQTRIPSGTLYGLMSSEAQFLKAEASAIQTRQAFAVITSIYCLNILDALLWKTSVKTANGELNSQFYTKFQIAPAVNSYLTTSVSPQIEFGFKVEF